MEPSTRERILDLLQKSPNLTPAEMSSRLRVTRHDVRYHLKFLLERGLVVRMPPEARAGVAGRGRPAMVYQLSPAARPDTTAQLAGYLLEILQNKSDAQSMLQELAFRLVPAAPPQPSQTRYSQHLNTCIHEINRYPYQARWEAHSTGPQIIFGNCPFAQIIEAHPELCQVDRRMIENLTGLQVTQTRKIDLSNPGAPACVFRLVRSAPLEKK